MSRWFILPGMGASPAMYDSLRPEMTFEANFINWPDYQGESTFTEVAHKIIDKHGIRAEDIVGGSSLGGMIALEIANLIGNKKIVLIGSAIYPQEVQPVLAKLAPLAKLTPVKLIQILAGKQSSQVARMFSESDPDFIRAMCLGLNSWQGFAGATESVYRIHGQKDYVITCPAKGVEVIKGGGHLIAMTHPKDVSRFLIAIDKSA